MDIVLLCLQPQQPLPTTTDKSGRAIQQSTKTKRYSYCLDGKIRMHFEAVDSMDRRIGKKGRGLIAVTEQGSKQKMRG